LKGFEIRKEIHEILNELSKKMRNHELHEGANEILKETCQFPNESNDSLKESSHSAREPMKSNFLMKSMISPTNFQILKGTHESPKEINEILQSRLSCCHPGHRRNTFLKMKSMRSLTNQVNPEGNPSNP